MSETASVLRGLADKPELLEIGRQAIEDRLIECRDSRLSNMRGNGFVILEKNGDRSDIIRFGPEDGLRIALKAIAEYLEPQADTPGDSR